MYPVAGDVHISSYQYQVLVLLKSILVLWQMHSMAKPRHAFETCHTNGEKTVKSIMADIYSQIFTSHSTDNK